MNFDKRKRVFVVLLALIAGAGLVGLAWRYRSYAKRMYYTGRVLLTADETISANGDFTNIIFVHHSTGRNLINQGQVRDALTAAGYEFWDHDYNEIGLTRPDGQSSGYSYNLPGDNTDPDGYAALFAQPVRERPVNAFSSIMQHEVILFKSCFPTSNIVNAEQLENYKGYYREIRAAVNEYPDHLFVAFTPPPLAPESTTPEAAARARAFADWLGSPEFLEGHPNLHVFDFFDLLAEGDPNSPDYNMLKAEYRPGGGDSHPNELANQTIGPQLVTFVVEAIELYQSLQG